MKNLLLLVPVLIVSSCTNVTSTPNSHSKDSIAVSKKDTSSATSASAPAAIADAATIMSRTQVPILCYHHIKEAPAVSKSSMGYEVTASQFKAQMKTLADSGYHTVLPEQLYDYLTKGAPLPEKPVMITYDDTDEEQFSIAKPEMDKYGFKGVYFIMTISIGRPRYMTTEQIKQLSDEGHVIANHTWDHHRTDRYKTQNEIEERGVKKIVNDWDQQLGKTKTKLEEITGKKVEYFAYPFGVWSPDGIPEIKSRGFKLAFQLSTKRDSSEPLYTVRRIIVAPSWSAEGLIRVMKSSFK